MAENCWQYPRARVLLFARAPQLGRVKTRLQQHLGAQRTLQVYCQLLQQVWSQLHDSALCPMQLYAADQPDHVFFSQLPSSGLPVCQQQGEDLGARMQNAAHEALQLCEAVVLVGSDCLSVDAEYLEQALSALHGGHEIVIGPAEDGGYVLLGLRRADVPVFDDMPWGGDAVMSLTRRRLQEAGLPWHELAPRWDIDTLADLARAGIWSSS